MDGWSSAIDLELCRSLDDWDQLTGAHCERVAHMAVQLGGLAGLRAHDLGVLALGARLHDLGKVGMPVSILQKEGPLDADQWAAMRAHSVRGETIVKEHHSLPCRLEVAAIVRHHHEHWDGTGYPDGLAGEAIPLLARIVSIVDSFDAMTSARPYHRARTPAEVIETLQSERGSKHDPVLLDLFLERIVAG